MKLLENLKVSVSSEKTIFKEYFQTMCTLPFALFFCIRKSCQRRGHCQSKKWKTSEPDKNAQAIKKRAEYIENYLKKNPLPGK